MGIMDSYSCSYESGWQRRYKELVARYMAKGASRHKAECVARRNMTRTRH